MSHSQRLIIPLAAVLQLSGCSSETDKHEKIEPAHVEHIEGSEASLVILTPRAAERLAIETAAVQETHAARTRTVAGEVIALPDESELIAGSDMVPTSTPAGTAGGKLGVLLAAGEEFSGVVAEAPARVMPRGYAGDQPVTGRAVGWTASRLTSASNDPLAGSIYRIDQSDPGLAPGQRVRVALPVSTTASKVVPYSAIMYDAHGETWVYANPEPLHFIRHRVVVDYIDGDLAILSEGPAIGTRVVTVGAAELYGTEHEVGH